MNCMNNKVYRHFLIWSDENPGLLYFYQTTKILLSNIFKNVCLSCVACLNLSKPKGIANINGIEYERIYAVIHSSNDCKNIVIFWITLLASYIFHEWEWNFYCNIFLDPVNEMKKWTTLFPLDSNEINICFNYDEQNRTKALLLFVD